MVSFNGPGPSTSDSKTVGTTDGIAIGSVISADGAKTVAISAPAQTLVPPCRTWV